MGIAGDTALLVVGLLVAYQLAGTGAVALFAIVRMVPATLVTLLANVGRLGRLERALLLVHLTVTVASAGAGLAILAGAPVVALACMGLAAGVGALVRPTQQALVPALATRPEELLSANVAMSLGEGLGTLVGPLVATLVVVASGSAAGAMVGAAFAGLATVLLVRVRVAEAARTVGHDGRGLPILRGLATLRRRPAAGIVIASLSVQTFARGSLTTLLVVLGIEVLAAGETGVGLLNGAIGLGGFLGAIATLRLVAGTRLAPAFSLAFAFWGIPLFVIGVVPAMIVAFVALTVVGIANAVLDVTAFTLLQRAVPSAQRVGVFAVLESSAGIGAAVGGAAAPLLVATLGVEGSFLLVGGILPAAALLTRVLVTRLDAEQVVPARTAALLRGVPLFCALPLDGLERLAVGIRPAAFAPGDTLLAEGERGDRYLLLASGSASVSQQGHEIGRVGPGDGIGEIALLRAVPRTATVTALEPIEAWTLDAATFLAAVTGHERARRSGDEVVERHLDDDAVRAADAL